MATPGAGPCSRLPRQITSPCVGASRPAMMRSSVDLPDPERPSRPDDLAGPELQLDIVQHDQVGAAVLVIGLPHAADLEQQVGASTIWSMRP